MNSLFLWYPKCSTCQKAKKWLDEYFNGKKPEISELDLAPIGSEFAKNVWEILCEIPYGKIKRALYIAHLYLII